MNDASENQTRTMRWILFWLFTGLFSIIVFATLAVVFYGFGHPTSEERNLLVKVFISEVGASVVALFWSIFKLRQPTTDYSVPVQAPLVTKQDANPNKMQLASIDHAEVDFLKAFLTIFSPDTSPGDPYSKIIGTHFLSIQKQLKRLDQEGGWEDLISLRERLREYFEYSGRYHDGIFFGNAYVRALKHLGKSVDAVWAKIKDVGYMLVLAGEHKSARETLNNSLTDLKDLESKGITDLYSCYFYCFRYLGISYHRDEEFGDLKRAMGYFKEAQTWVDKLKNEPRKYKPLYARLLGNMGNLALSESKFLEALEQYQKSYELFREIGDTEHIGIAELQIGQTIISRGEGVREAFKYLQESRLRFIRIGWIEGQARVAQQIARYFEHLIDLSSPKSAKEYVELGLQYAKESKKLFERVKNERHIGRIDEIIERLTKAQLAVENSISDN